MDSLQIWLLLSIVVLLVAAGIVSKRIKNGEVGANVPSSIKSGEISLEDKTKKRPYSIGEYDPTWPLKFQAIKETLAGVFKEKALAIEHVGSTSIPGMKAKPIIDALIIVQRIEPFTTEKRLMEALGYKWGDNYIAPGTIVFYKESPDASKTENVHVCEAGSPKAKQFINMRNYFRANPEKAVAYTEHPPKRAAH